MENRINLFGTNPPADPLTGLAFDKLISRLRQFGNEPAFAQQSVLRAILASFTMAVENRRAGKRIVHPTPTGAGKTTAVVCWVAALHELGRLGEISLAVSCSHVEALCGLKRELISMGVPPEKIGLLHSYGYKKANAELLMAGEVLNSGDWASEPSTPNRSDPLQNSERPVLLISHNRISRNPETIEYMKTSFNGVAGRRNLLIYDESLIGSTTSTCSMIKLKKGIALCKEEKYRFDPIHKEALRFVSGCFTQCYEEMRRIRDLKNRGIEETPAVLQFPDLPSTKREEYRKAIRSLDDGLNRGYLKQITEFISMTGQDMTVFYYRSDNLSDEQKERLIDFHNYENNGKWYLLLDEAHKGDKEDSKRQHIYSILSRAGFLFNFSATFTDPRDILTAMDDLVARRARATTTYQQRRWLPWALVLAGLFFLLLDFLLGYSGSLFMLLCISVLNSSKKTKSTMTFLICLMTSLIIRNTVTIPR